MDRRVWSLLVAIVPIVAFTALAFVVPVPYVSLGPGPTFNTLGEVNGKEVVDIEGTEVHPSSGHLNMTTVEQRDGPTLVEAMALWMTGREQLVPRDLVYPPDKTREEIDKSNASDFESSEAAAKFAALNYLEFPKAVTVETVNDPGPSAGKLQSGDAIDKVNGTAITSLDQFQSLLKQTKPGESITLEYRRKTDPPATATVTLGTNEDRDYGFLGIGVLEVPWAPFSVTFNLANVGGPSAGLMFSLAVVDKLTTGDLTGDKFVAGTGTITVDGEVGPIGGITHKMVAAHDAGATVFLVPADNCDEARSGNEDGLELVKVSTLTEAVDALKTVTAGGEPPRC